MNAKYICHSVWYLKELNKCFPLLLLLLLLPLLSLLILTELFHFTVLIYWPFWTLRAPGLPGTAEFIINALNK